MPTLIEHSTRVQATGNLPKIIDEYIGRLNSQEGRISVAHMRSPAGWEEPGQTPEFEEYTIVLRGSLHVRHNGGILEVRAGQAIIAHPGEWIQYSTPKQGAEYIAICLPAFSPGTVHRDKIGDRKTQNLTTKATKKKPRTRRTAGKTGKRIKDE